MYYNTGCTCIDLWSIPWIP